MGSGELIVGHGSALDYWRAARSAYVEGAPEAGDGKVYGARPLTLSQKAQRVCRACGSCPPLSIVVPAKSERHNCALIENRVFRGPLGPEHLRNIEEGVRVCSAEATFVQLAGESDKLDLALLASELCGTYGVVVGGGESLKTGLSPLTSIVRLRSYAMACNALKVRGAAAALDALGLAVDGAASPREAELAAFFLMGRRLGGAELQGFSVNARLEVPDEFRQVTSKKYLMPDFFWEGCGLVVEYDSNQYHLKPEQKQEDETRRRIFERMGCRHMSLTNDVLMSDALLNDFVSDMERSMGMRRKPLSRVCSVRRSEMRKRLFCA